MTEVDYEIKKLEGQLAGLKKSTKRAEQIRRLYDNKDFQSVILEGWFVEEAARFAKNAGDPNMLPSAREDSLAQAMAAGHLDRYLRSQMKLGNGAVEEEIRELESRIIYLRANGTIVGYGEEHVE